MRKHVSHQLQHSSAIHSVETFAEHFAGGTIGATASDKACCFKYDGLTPIAEAEPIQRRRMQLDAKDMARLWCVSCNSRSNYGVVRLLTLMV